MQKRSAVALRRSQRPHACWNCWFESRWGRAYLFLVSVVYRQAPLYASGWSLVQLSLRVCVCLMTELGGSGSLQASVPKGGGGGGIYIYTTFCTDSLKNVKTLKQYFGRDSNQAPQNIKMQARSFITTANMHSNLCSNTSGCRLKRIISTSFHKMSDTTLKVLFIRQLMPYWVVLNNIKIYVKSYIKIAPTCFGVTVTPPSGSALIYSY